MKVKRPIAIDDLTSINKTKMFNKFDEMCILEMRFGDIDIEVILPRNLTRGPQPWP